MRFKRATGSLAAPREGKPKGSVLDAHAAFILGLIEETPDITLEEIAVRPAEEREVKVVHTAVWKFLDRRGMTHKKDCSCLRTGARRCESGARGLAQEPAPA